MDRCLKTLDILGIIFDAVYEDPDKGLRTTAALATTCVTFQEPALDVLWRSIPSLVPLVKCLPADSWEEDGGFIKTVKLTRTLKDEELNNCRRYVRRIRQIGCGVHGKYSPLKTGEHTLAQSIYDVLEVHGIIPIKHLRSYKVSCETEYITLQRVIGPAIVDLDFAHCGKGSRLDSQYPDFTLPPSLRTMRFHETLSFTPSSFLSPLLNPHFLEVLHLPSFWRLHDDGLRALLLSSTLRELELPANLSEDWMRCMPPKSPLRLRHLNLTTERLWECREIIGSIDCSLLQSINIRYHDENEDYDIPLASEVESLFHNIELLCSIKALKTVYLEGPVTLDECPDEYCITMSTIRPLLSFCNLESLTIFSETGFILDNESLNTFTTSWPKMRHLELNGRDAGWGFFNPYKITLDGLTSIAQSWHDLECLNICFTAETKHGTSISDIPFTDFACAKLKQLAVGDSPLSMEPLMAAAFLHNIFPNLSAIVSGEDMMGSPWEWDEVQPILEYLVKLRQRTRQACWVD